MSADILCVEFLKITIVSTHAAAISHSVTNKIPNVRKNKSKTSRKEDGTWETMVAHEKLTVKWICKRKKKIRETIGGGNGWQNRLSA